MSSASWPRSCGRGHSLARQCEVPLLRSGGRSDFEGIRWFTIRQLWYRHPAVKNVHFNVGEAASGQFPYVNKHYSPILGADLCVVGETDDNYLLLLMDEQGRFFTRCDEDFRYLGDFAVKAIEALCSESDLPRVEDILV